MGGEEDQTQPSSPGGGLTLWGKRESCAHTAAFFFKKSFSQANPQRCFFFLRQSRSFFGFGRFRCYLS